MSSKYKTKQNNLNSKNRFDDEETKKSLLKHRRSKSYSLGIQEVPKNNYEGGNEENKNNQNEGDANQQQEEEPKKNEPKEDNEKDQQAEVDNNIVEDQCLCCKLDTSIITIAIILIVLAVFIFVNICIIFANEYYPWWFPTPQFFMFGLYVAGIVIICVWFCKDTPDTRICLRVAGYLILAGVVSIIMWNVMYIVYFQRKSSATMRVGAGKADDHPEHDPDDYEEETKTEYVLGYIIWGFILIIIIILYLISVERYIDLKKQEEEDETPMMEDEEKKPMMEKEKEEKKDDDKANDGEKPAEPEDGQNAEGGQREPKRMSNKKKLQTQTKKKNIKQK